jgi:hypothetical protein
MAYDYSAIIVAQGDRLQAQRQRALRDLETARLDEDTTAVHYAADEILKIDGDIARLEQIATGYMHQQQAQQYQQQANRWGLSEEEKSVAEASFPDRADMPKMSTDDKHRVYAEQRYKHRAMVANGSYGGSAGGRGEVM